MDQILMIIVKKCNIVTDMTDELNVKMSVNTARRVNLYMIRLQVFDFLKYTF